jgi:hypothetical protein
MEENQNIKRIFLLLFFFGEKLQNFKKNWKKFHHIFSLIWGGGGGGGGGGSCYFGFI